VASYTILFHLAPAADVTVAERRVAGVDVRVLSPVGGPAPEEAFAQLEGWLPELQAAVGPLPMPRGLSLVLTPTGGGMEYYGGSITSLRALQHEVFHMYWGCSTVMRTYRDSWLDEAVNMWYALSKDPALAPIEQSFRSDIVSARSPIGTGFDRRAYDEGARVVEAIARDLGSRDAAVAWLRQVHATRSFAPSRPWTSPASCGRTAASTSRSGCSAGSTRPRGPPRWACRRASGTGSTRST